MTEREKSINVIIGRNLFRNLSDERLDPKRLHTAIGLPVENLVPATQDLFEGKIIHWGEPGSAEEFFYHHGNKNGLFAQMLTTIITSQNPEVHQALDVVVRAISSDLQEQETTNTRDFEKVWQKHLIFGSFFYYMHMMRQLQPDFYQKHAQQLESLYRGHCQIVADILNSAPLVDFIKCCDVIYEGREQYKDRQLIGIVMNIPTPVFDEIFEATEERWDFYKAITREAEVETWTRLKTNWNWEQITNAVSLLAEIKSHLVLDEVQYSLFRNLQNLDARQETKEIASADGISRLLENHWQDSFSVEPAKIKEEVKDIYDIAISNSVQFKESSIPSIYLPNFAITYLQEAQRANPGVFRQRLYEINNLVQAKEDLQNNWLLTLLFFSNQNKVVNAVLEDFLENSHLSPEIVDILRDVHPGKLWLDPRGRLRPRDNKSSLASAYIIHQSTAPELEPEQNPPVVVFQKETKIPEGQKQTEDVFDYDFVGNVATIKDEEVVAHLEDLDKRNVFFEEELLLNLDRLQGKYTPFSEDKTMIFNLELNPSDAACKEAKRLGIETVVIAGNVVTFILDKNSIWAVNEDDQLKLPIGITGTFDQKGWLQIDALGEKSPKDNIYLALTNIALELLGHQNQLPKKPEDMSHQERLELQEVQKAARQQIADWNRSKAANSTKLSWNPNPKASVFIALRPADKTTFTSI